MDDHQWSLIQDNKEKILDFLVEFAHQFLQYLEEKNAIDGNIRSAVSNAAKFDRDLMFLTLTKLKQLPNGWIGLSGFIDKYKRKDLLAPQTVKPIDRTADENPLNWRQFIRDVTDFYLGGYRVVGSFDEDGDSDLIESVWVDLQLVGSRKPIDGYKEIFAQMRAKNCRLAIVRGQPGSGKTTLAKKIAYDWAKQGKKEIFDLILAVPLRDVQSKSDLLEMAVGFCLGTDDYTEAKRICADLRREKLKVLIVLDGLDEFPICSNSPLTNIFCSTPHSFNTVRTKPIRFDFDLLVTSRPFACQLIHANVAAVKYEIVGFSEEKKVEFVGKRCKKAEGKAKANEYFDQSNCLKEISQNPFLLTLICFLSDLNETIPSTLTKLYDTFLHRMLIRAARKNAVGKDFDPFNWQQSELLKNLGSLALLGVIKNQFQFNRDEMQMCHVREDFHSGLLQYRSDPVGLALQCDFPHRSIQDFLAAFYAVHYWGDKTLTEATGWPDTIWSGEFVNFLPQMKVELLMAQLVYSDSQFCRFFFGLISGKLQISDFENRYRLFLAETFGNFTAFLLDPLIFMSFDLADCSDEENFAAGQIVNDMADLYADFRYLHPTELEEKNFKFKYGEDRQLRTFSDLSFMCNQLTFNFRMGMKLSRIGLFSFSVGTENPQNVKFFYFSVNDEKCLKDIGKHSPYSHIGHVYIFSTCSLHDNIRQIRQILTHIPSVFSFEITEVAEEPQVSTDFMISVRPQQADSPKCFSLKHLLLSVSTEDGQIMLKRFQSSTNFQPDKMKVTSVDKWKLFDFVSVTIAIDNSMSNFDIFNAIRSD